jgi:tetratricopeptide (TPR) repeat protein
MIRNKIILVIVLLSIPVMIFAQGKYSVKFKKEIGESDKKYLLSIAKNCFAPEGAFNFSIVSQDIKPDAYKGAASKRTMPEDTVTLFKKLEGSTTPELVYRDLGLTFQRLNMYNRASYYLQKAFFIYDEKLKKDNNNAAILSEIGDVQSNMNNYPQAIYYYSQALLKNPKDTTARAMITLSYIKLGEYAKAGESVNANIKAEPANINHYIWLPLVSFYEMYLKSNLSTDSIERKFKNKSVDEIIDLSVLKKAADTYKDDYSFALFYQIARNMSLVFKASFTFSQETKKFEPDAADLKEMASLEKFYNEGLNHKDFSNKFIFYKAMAMLKLMNNEYDNAIPLFREALKYKPIEQCTFDNNPSEVYDDMVAAYMLKRDTIAAMKMLKEKMDSKPSINPAYPDYEMMARFQMSQNQYADAEKSCKEILRLDDLSSDPYLGLAILALINNDLKAAEDRINAAYKFNPNDADIYMMFGILSMFQNKADAAYYAFQTVLDIRGTDEEAKKIMDEYFIK